MKVTIQSILFMLILPMNLLSQPDVPPDGAAFDHEENMYYYRIIGQQKWLIDNINSQLLSDKSPISMIQDSLLWSQTNSPAYCYYPADRLDRCAQGNLYNWQTVNTGKLCPLGWHVPNNAEWQELADFAGGNEIAGGKLKISGTDVWMDPNTNGSDAFGFSMAPGGFRTETGQFMGLCKTAAYWSADASDENNAYVWFTSYNSAYLAKDTCDKKNGLSVICIQDK
ncbi:MAG: FISUMP domain-containing protein [Bacteroidales bacterium]|jgi:uncharacterized protein (TIGR02145 family)|nr:FISUMP domain-containing protein [Bacteroidales bacterium]